MGTWRPFSKGDGGPAAAAGTPLERNKRGRLVKQAKATEKTTATRGDNQNWEGPCRYRGVLPWEPGEQRNGSPRGTGESVWASVTGKLGGGQVSCGRWGVKQRNVCPTGAAGESHPRPGWPTGRLSGEVKKSRSSSVKLKIARSRFRLNESNGAIPVWEVQGPWRWASCLALASGEPRRINA